MKQTFRIALFLLTASASLLGAEVRKVDLKAYSEEGRPERILLELDEASAADVFADIYEFHTMMRPDLAPQEDTWNHQLQMQHMKDVLAGRQAPYAPDMQDPKLREILHTVAPLSLKMEQVAPRTFALNWIASHGRIFFRFRAGDETLGTVYSMRVHCRHADLRSVERLKQSLRQFEMPLQHGHMQMAAELLPTIRALYREGHSLRYMMTHHEHDVSALDASMQSLEAAVQSGDRDRAADALAQVVGEVRRAEQIFRQADVRRSRGQVSVRLHDLTGFDYSGDPSSEVYVRRAGLEPPPHPMPAAGAHSAHQHAAPPDKAALTKGAIRMQPDGADFRATVPEDWEQLEIVVLYGRDQNFFWTAGE